MALHLTTTTDGRAALDDLRRVVVGAKGSDPLAPVTVVVPTNAAGVLARRALGRAGGIAAVQFLTAYRLAELLGGPALAAAGRRPVSTPVVSAAVQRVLVESPGRFAPVHEHETTVAAALRGYRELRGLDPGVLRGLGIHGTPLAAELVRVHDQVRRRLVTDWYDEADLLDAAGTAIEHGAGSALGTVVLHLPIRLSAPAGRLVRRLAATTPVHVVLATSGDPVADRAAARLAGELGVTLPPAAPFATVPVELVSMSDADEEVRDAVRQVTDAARRGIPLERVALLWTTAVPYQRLVGEQLAAAGIAWNGPSPIGLAEHLAGRTLLALLAVDRFGLRRRDLFGLLGNAPIRDRSGRPVPAAAWERIARTAAIGRDDEWAPRLAEFAARQRAASADRSAAGDEAAAARMERDAGLADQLAAYVAWLRRELGSPTARRPWRDWAAWCHRLLGVLLGEDAVRVRLPAVERSAFERVESALDRLAGLDELAPPADRATFGGALTAALDGELLRSGRIGDGVLVGSLTSAIGLDTELTIVVGLAEGTFPAPPPVDPLLTDSDRRLAGGGLPVADDLLAEQRRALLAALRSGSLVVACVPRGDLRRSCVRTPSRWLTELTGADPAAGRTVHSFAAGVGTATFPATAGEHRLRGLLGHTRAGAAIDTHPLVAADATVRRNLALVRAREQPALTAYDGDLSGLPIPSPFDAGTTVSPTRLEAWVGCPHRYLMQYVLRIPEPDDRDQQLRISALDRGNLLHATLDRFLRAVLDAELPCPAPSEPWSRAHATHALAILDDECAQAERAGLTGRSLLWERDRQLLRLELCQWLLHDDRERAERGLTPVESEQTFGRPGGSWPAAPVRLPSGRLVHFSGSIDRLDRTADGRYLVTDHKTGSSRKFEKIGPGQEFVDGSKLQLAVYAAAVAAAKGISPVGITAEYSFTRTHQRKGYTIDTDVWERFTGVLDTIGAGIDQGLFPARPAPPGFRVWVDCAFCDPDGLGTGDVHRRWLAVQDDARLTPYLELIGERSTGRNGDDDQSA